METAPLPPRTRFLSLPGFYPDAVSYAFRTTLALILAYGVGFYAQIPTASSAGITVGIIAQPSTGMALSKAAYRIGGTVLGCIVSLIFGAAFGQDRTMLLFAFALWMGLCAAAASLLRDFRSYGAALSGYTVAIIAIGGIDSPDGLLLASLNRTAAILLGIAAVAVVNSLLPGVSALDNLIAKLREERDRVAAFAADALEGRPIPDDLTLTRRIANITSLQSDATYAAMEHANGRRRRRGAQVAIGSLLTAISASRTIAGLLTPDTPVAVRDPQRLAAAALRDGAPLPPALPIRPPTADPFDTLLLERADAILRRMRDTDAGLLVLDGSAKLPTDAGSARLPMRDASAQLPMIVLHPTHDVPAAFISAVRSIIAFGLTATFGVLAGWPDATLMLIQQAAFVGLLGASATPTAASVGFIVPLFPIALVTGLVEFTVLPLTSGFVPFSVVVGGLMFTVALLGRHRRLAPLAPAALIYLTLLLSPSNPATFDLANFLNTFLQVGLSVVFTLLTFLLILPVSPKRRLYRVVAAVAGELSRTLRSGGARLDPAVAQAMLYDRLVRALTFLGRPTKARQALLSHLYRLGASEIAAHRARRGLSDIERAAAATPAAAAADGSALRSAITEAHRTLDARDYPGMLAAARALLAIPGIPAGPALQQAVSGLADLAYQEGARHRITRFFQLMID